MKEPLTEMQFIWKVTRMYAVMTAFFLALTIADGLSHHWPIWLSVGWPFFLTVVVNLWGWRYGKPLIQQAKEMDAKREACHKP